LLLLLVERFTEHYTLPFNVTKPARKVKSFRWLY